MQLAIALQTRRAPLAAAARRFIVFTDFVSPIS
jgi:hypothetical protein